MTTTPAATNLPPLHQIRNISSYDDEVAFGAGTSNPAAGTTSLEDDVQTIITLLNLHINGAVAGNDFYQTTVAPTTFENGVVRGINDNNQAVHDIERQRILKFLSKVGADIGISSAATGTLTSTGVNVSNGDTVTIDVKTYTFEVTLTNVDGNVQIGASAAATLSNLQGAINLTGTPGTDYALAMTIHPTVYAESITATTLVGTAKVQGTAGNSIASTEVATTLSWGAGTLAGGGSTTDVVVLSPGQLVATTTTAAIGSVTTLGIVGATAGSFGTGSLDLVAGANGVQSKNQCVLIDTATGDALTRISDGKQVYGFWQYESAADGSTFTGFAPDRVQMSLVVQDGAGTAMELITAGDVPITVSINYAAIRRDAFQDCPEEAWLTSGFVEGGAAVDSRELVYAEQGAAAFTTVTNATLNLGTGFSWEIGDVTAAGALFTVTENSGTSSSDVTIGADVDTYVNSAVDVDFTNGITVDTSDGINIGIIADTIEFSGNATVTTSSASTMLVTADSANATLSTTTSGSVILSSVASVLVDGTVLSLDGTDTTNLTMTSNAAGTKTLSIAATNAGAGVADVTVSADGRIDLQAAAAVTIDSSGSTIDIGTDANTGAINVGTAASARTITIGNATGITATNLDSGTGGTAITSTGEVDATGTCVGVHPVSGGEDTSSFHSEMERFQLWGTSATTVNGSYVGHNTQRVSITAKEAGTWVVLSTSATVTDTITSTAAAVAATTDANVGVASSANFSVGDLVTITGSADDCNDDIYEVASIPDGTNIRLRGPNGVTTRLMTFTGLDLTAAGAGGTIQKATVSVIQTGTDGLWEGGTGDDTTIAFTNFQGATTLQEAYENGNTIVTDSTNLGFDVSGTEAFSLDGAAASNVSTTSADLVISTITSGELDLTSAGLMDLNAGANLDVDVTGTFDVLSTGAFSIDGTGSSNVTATSGDLTLGTATSGDILVTTDVGDASVTALDALLIVKELDRNAATAAGSIVNRSTFTSFENGTEGNLSVNYGTGYTSNTGTNTFQVSVVSCATGAGATTISAFTNNGAAVNPTATTAGSGTFSVGDMVLVTGSVDERNNGFFEVLTHVTTTLTLDATPTVGVEFVRQQVATTAGDTASICLATLAVFRVNSSGDFQIAEAFTNSASINYIDIGTTATTLEIAWANATGAGATLGLSGFTGSITDGDVYRVQTLTGSNTLLSLNAVLGADVVGIGNADTATVVDIDGGSGGVLIDTASGGAISIDAIGALINLTTTTTGAIEVDGVDGVGLNSTGGALNIGDDANTGAINVGTGAAARTITMGNVTGATALDFDAGTGAFSFDSTTADTAAFMDWATTGTGGDAVGVFIGNTSPNARVTGSIGSLFVDGAAAALWQNTDGGTAWTQFAAAGDTSLEAAWAAATGAGATLGASGFTGRITDTDTYLIATLTTNDNLLSLAAVAGADVVTIGNAISASVVDIDSGTGGTLIDSTGGISLGAAAASDFTVAAANLTFQTTGSGDIAVTSVGDVDVDGVNVTLDATAGVSIDAAAASNFSLTAGTLTFKNTSAVATDDVTVEANAGDVNILSTSGDILATAADGCITVESTKGNIGTIDIGAAAIHFHDDGNGDQHLVVQTEFTANSTTTWGLSGTYRGSSVTTTVGGAGIFAAVGAASDAIIEVASTAGFAAGDLIVVTGANTLCNNGLYEVFTAAGIALTLRSLGLNAPLTDFVKDQVTTDSTLAGSVTVINVASLRAGTDGIFEVADFTDNTATYTDLVTSAQTVTKNFFQDTITGSSVSAGGTLTAASFTGSAIAVRPTTNFVFDSDAQIWLNGLLLFNGTGNEVTGTGTNNIFLEAGAPRFNVGDVVTISYTQNATTTTA